MSMQLRTSPISTALRGVLALTLLCSPRTAAAAPPLLGPAPAQPQADASCPTAAQAVSSIGAGKYSEAARVYEQCARATNDPGLWKKAGMARHSARQYAQAIQALTAAISAGGADPQAEAILEDARKHAVTVRIAVAVSPGAAAPERLWVAARDAAPGDELDLPWPGTATAIDVWVDPGHWTAEIFLKGGARVGPRDVRAASGVSEPQVVLFRVEAPVVAPPVAVPPVDVELTLEPGAALKRGVDLLWSGPPGQTREQVRTTRTRWQLAPGTWQLEVKAPRFVTQTRAIDLRPGQPSQMVLTLRRTPMEKARIGLAVGTGAVGLGLLVGGLAVALRGRRDYRGVADELDGGGSPAARAAVTTALPAIRDMSNGTMLATSALGAGVAAVTVAAEGSNTLLTVEAGVGGVLLIAGLAWLVPAKRQYGDMPDGASPDLAFLDEHRRPELAAAGLLGLGAGLAAGATLSLITRAVLQRGKRSSKTARSLPRFVGLGVQGNF
jgi:ribosomal protein S14